MGTFPRDGAQSAAVARPKESKRATAKRRNSAKVAGGAKSRIGEPDEEQPTPRGEGVARPGGERGRTRKNQRRSQQSDASRQGLRVIEGEGRVLNAILCRQFEAEIEYLELLKDEHNQLLAGIADFLNKSREHTLNLARLLYRNSDLVTLPSLVTAEEIRTSEGRLEALEEKLRNVWPAVTPSAVDDVGNSSWKTGTIKASPHFPIPEITVPASFGRPDQSSQREHKDVRETSEQSGERPDAASPAPSITPSPDVQPGTLSKSPAPGVAPQFESFLTTGAPSEQIRRAARERYYGIHYDRLFAESDPELESVNLEFDGEERGSLTPVTSDEDVAEAERLFREYCAEQPDRLAVYRQ